VGSILGILGAYLMGLVLAPQYLYLLETRRAASLDGHPQCSQP